MNVMVKQIPMLAILLEAYYDEAELIESAGVFGVSLPEVDPFEPKPGKKFWVRAAKQIIGDLSQGNNYVLLSSLTEQLEVKNSIAIARTKYEQRQANEALAPKIRDLQEALGKVASPSAIMVPEASPFTAKAEIRDMLATATTDVLIVDPYIGVGTLDCLLAVAQPVRLLTGDKPNSIESHFQTALKDFVAEGYTLEVRRATMLHDRHLVFNDRCWLVGSSLKDAGKKALNCLEIVDKTVVVADLEAKWTAATPSK